MFNSCGLCFLFQLFNFNGLCLALGSFYDWPYALALGLYFMIIVQDYKMPLDRCSGNDTHAPEKNSLVRSPWSPHGPKLLLVLCYSTLSSLADLFSHPCWTRALASVVGHISVISGPLLRHLPFGFSFLTFWDGKPFDISEGGFTTSSRCDGRYLNGAHL